MDGRTFNPPSSHRHIPLLCVDDLVGAQRNLIDWMNTLVRGQAAVSHLYGKPGQAQQAEKNTTYYQDENEHIVDDDKLT